MAFEHVTDPKLRAILNEEDDDLDYARRVTMEAIFKDYANKDIPLLVVDRRREKLRTIPPTLKELQECWST